MVLAQILIYLPFTGLRPVRALRVRGRKVPKPTRVTRLPFATLVTIASNTAFPTSPAAALLTFPAFGAAWTRSDLVTTCGMRSPPDVPNQREGRSYPNEKRNTTRVLRICTRRWTNIYDYGTSRRRTHDQANHHRARRRCEFGCARTIPAHLFELGATDAPPHHLAGQLGGRRREGHRRPRQIPVAAEGARRAAGHLRRGARRPGGPVVRHRELHAGAPHPAADGRAARRRRYRRGQLGGLLAHPLEAFPQGRREQRRQAARGVDAWPGADVHQEAAQVAGRLPEPEDPHRRRHLGRGDLGAGRLAVLQAG